MSTLTNITVTTYSNVAAVCPQAPPGAQAPVDQLTGYLLWGVIALFIVGFAILIAVAVGATFFRMPHAAKGALAGMAVLFVAAIGYFVGPEILNVILGSGCIDINTSGTF